MFDRLECHDWGIEGYPGEYVYGDDVYVDDYYIDMDERWLPIGRFPSYWVSTLGRVYSVRSRKFLKPQMDSSGHFQVRLSNERETRLVFVHRLMAEAFIDNPEGCPIVRHLDDDPSNNELYNLAWGTQKDNAKDSIRNRSREQYYTPIVATYRPNGKRFYFSSQHEAARALGLNQGNIAHVLSGSMNNYRDWHFEYVDKDENL